MGFLAYASPALFEPQYVLYAVHKIVVFWTLPE